jgi:phosphoribosylamine---glycine ligase
MAVSGGYPTGYQKGFKIEGLDKECPGDSLIFQAGTKTDNDSTLTDGGRVLCITSYGKTIQEAVSNSLDVLDQIHYEGMYYRTDIGYEFS